MSLKREAVRIMLTRLLRPRPRGVPVSLHICREESSGGTLFPINVNLENWSRTKKAYSWLCTDVHCIFGSAQLVEHVDSTLDLPTATDNQRRGVGVELRAWYA